MAGVFRFFFGPWNIHEGPNRLSRQCARASRSVKSWSSTRSWVLAPCISITTMLFRTCRISLSSRLSGKAAAVKKKLDTHGLVAEFVAPRLWEDLRTIEGACTSSDLSCREYARERSRRAIDIANALGTDLIVLWLAREGTYIREAKDSVLCLAKVLRQGLHRQDKPDT